MPRSVGWFYQVVLVELVVNVIEENRAIIIKLEVLDSQDDATLNFEENECISKVCFSHADEFVEDLVQVETLEENDSHPVDASAGSLAASIQIWHQAFMRQQTPVSMRVDNQHSPKGLLFHMMALKP